MAQSAAAMRVREKASGQTGQSSVEHAGRQSQMILIGQELVGMSNRESLLNRAVSFLRNDFSYESARIDLNGSATDLSDFATRVPVRWGAEILGNIIIPFDGRQPDAVEVETLTIFAGFLAVGINNVVRLEEALSLASVDPLTGVMNRRRLFEVGPTQMTRARTTGLIVFDIDRFKTINDTFGHLAGDALLKVVADRAAECVRKTDFLARYGGDEFVILLPATDRDVVREIAERVRTNIENSLLDWNGNAIRSTVSVGFACIPGEMDLYSLLNRADMALLAAKNSGRNLVRHAY